jgi:hypothetical protein
MPPQAHSLEKNILKVISPHLEKCIEACTRCHQICDETVEHYLFKPSFHFDPAHIRLLRDCAQISSLAADFMLRDSEFQAQICGLCADICRTCAEDCEALDENDEIMKLCAQVCRRCAETCAEVCDLHN